MQPFKYLRVVDQARAIEAMTPPNARFIAGGTLLVDLMKLGVETPTDLVDVNGVPLDTIEKVPEGLKIGAMSRNSDLANHPLVKASFPVLSEALLSGASPQLRNLATLGGNLMQRPRCSYFRDLAYDACNKRKPGSGCAALNGWTRMHAVLGTSDQCIAAHPSDMCVALAALDATVFMSGPRGPRSVPITEFHVVPGNKPDVETVLAHEEMITHVIIPDSAFAKHSRYVKVRDRASYAFALVSAAVALDVQGGTIKQARVALGGLATKPWRSKEAEQKLEGQQPSRDVFRAAAEAGLAGATPHKENAFKVELGKRTIVRALELVGGAT
jgi:xanthine dehydrogenase YagS FAD-binding subunit